jgi:hypothetical protein
MTSQDLRPMSIGEILDGSFTLYRNHFGTLIGISIVCLGIPTLLSVYVELGGGIEQQIGLGLLSLLLLSIGWLPSSAATVWAVSESYLGHRPMVGSALRHGLRKVGQLVVSGLAAYLLVGLAMLAFVIPGLVVACGYAVVVQVVVVEDLRSGTDALGRSWALTKGYKGKAFKLGIVIGALYLLPAIAGGALAAVMPSATTAIDILAQFVSFLVTPWLACVFTLFYYDLRVRQEAFDLELLSHTVERALPSAT